MMTQFQSFFTLDHILQISISIGILAAFLVLRKLFVKYFFQLIYKLANKPKTDIFKQIAVAFDKPARWFFVALGLFLAIEYSPFLDGQMDIVKKIIPLSDRCADRLGALQSDIGVFVFIS